MLIYPEKFYISDAMFHISDAYFATLMTLLQTSPFFLLVKFLCETDLAIKIY